MNEIYFSCDWGTSQFRLRAVRRADHTVADQLESHEGVAQLSQGDRNLRPSRYRQVLTDALATLSGRIGTAAHMAPCAISGMASSSVGWRELPYASVPLALDGQGLTVAELEPIAGPGGPHRAMLISGLRTDTDVMRGEETQLVGLFQLAAMQPLAQRSLVVLPGTHSKHVRVQQRQITTFHTFMTGELFDVLSHHSLLRHSVATADESCAAADATRAFRDGVLAARLEPLAAALFRVRTRQVLDNRPAAENREYLSGLLIGGEWAELVRREPADMPIILAAAATLAPRYVEAAHVLDLGERLHVVDGHDVDRLTCLGQGCLLAGRDFT